MKIFTVTFSLIFFFVMRCTLAVAQTITTGPVNGSISACAGTASAAPAIQQFTVSGSALTANIIVTAPANFEVSNNATSGYGNSFNILQIGGVANGTVYIRSAATAVGPGISGNVSLASTGAAIQTVAVNGTVIPLPVIDPVGNQNLAAGAFTVPVNFTGTAQDYKWTVDRPDIGIAATGRGAIPRFTAINNGSSPITATITVTPVPGSLAYVANGGTRNANTPYTISVVSTSKGQAVSNIPVGNSPTKTVVSPDGKRVYVVNYADHTISVIDAANGQVVRVVPVVGYPQDIEISPNGASLYVITSAPSQLIIMDTETGAKDTPINIGANSLLVIKNSDGTRLYAANFGTSGNYTVINTVTKTAQIISGYNNTGDMALSRNGAYLYLTESSANVVNVVSTATNLLVKKITVGGYPVSMAVHPDGSKLYVANQTSNSVSIINTADNTAIREIPVSAYNGITISPDGAFIYAVGLNDNISVIRTSDHTIVKIIPVSGNLSSPVISQDGTRLFVLDLIAQSIFIINTATYAVEDVKPVGQNPALFNNSVSPGLGCVGIPITFTITVAAPPPPIIDHTGSPAPLNTTYGTSSGSTSFNVSASRLSTGVLVSPPAGFEVSTDNITFAPTVTLGATGTLPTTRVYIRLSATSDANTYSGNIVLSSGPTTHNVAMPASVIGGAPITIIAGGIGKTYGMTLTDYTGPDRYTMDGTLTNGNRITAVTQHYGTGAAADDPVKDYVDNVTISIDEIMGDNGFKRSNYNIKIRPGTINVAPAELTLMAYDEPGKTYGTTLTSGVGKTEFLPTGLRNGETIGSVTLTYGAGAAAGDKVQLYKGSIVASAPVGGTFNINNYALKTPTTPGNIEVVPAILSVTADNKSKNFGQPNPGFTYSVTGFVNREDETVLTAKPTLSSPATTNTQWGAYPIIPAGAAANNYAFIYINGTLTIIPPVTLPGAVLKVNNTFTPNGDGINDTWIIPALANYPNCTVKIFDRRGAMLFNSIGYARPWDGTYMGAYLPSGVYYYLIDPKQDAKVIYGTITIIR